MSSWYNTFDAVFFITITTIITGSFGLALKFCLKSKCENFSCCYGLMEIERNVDIEAREEIKALELGQISPNMNSSRSLNNLNVSRDNISI